MRRWLFIVILILGILLRFYKLGEIPNSLHEDEVGVGYNAFTLLTTGRDEHGVYYPLTLREDAPPLPFYAAVPSLAVFGLNSFAVRFSSAMIGSLTLLAMFWLAIELGENIRQVNSGFFSPSKFALMCMLLLTILPWHVQLTRIVHSAEFALFIQVLAVASFFTFQRTRAQIWILVSGLLFGTGFYTYHSSRLTSPLLFVWLIWFFRKTLRYNKVSIIFSGLIALLIALPILISVLATPLPQTRFGGVNIFIGQNKDLTLLFHVPRIFIQQLAAQLDLRTLFIDSSNTRYFHVQGSGLLFLTLIPFFCLSLWQMRKTRFLVFFLVWGFIGLLPGALTLGPTNAGRTAGVLPALILPTGLGLLYLVKHKILNLAFFTFTCLLLFIFLDNYFVDSPSRFPQKWQVGLAQAAQFVTAHEVEYRHIIFAKSFRQPYIYVLFYGKKPLEWLLTNQPARNPVVGYTAFGKYEFRDIDWNTDPFKPQTLIVAPVDKVPTTMSASMHIKDQSGVPRISIIKIPSSSP